VERLLKTAEVCGSIVGIEPVADQHTVSSIELTDRLLRRLASPALKIIYDPVNLIPEAGLTGPQEAFFARAFDCFGEHIAAVHVKDFRMQEGKKTGDLPAGTGDLDYPAFFKILSERKPGIDILLENSNPRQVRETMTFLRKTADSVSL
jgi:sugar phosphate isomerase/epimerase